MAALKMSSRRWANEKGAEIIEMAFVMPILLLIVAGIIDFGLLFQRYQVVTNAAREGARVAILPNFTDTEIRQRVRGYLTASGLNATVEDPGVARTTQLLAAGGPSISVVTVTVRYPQNYLILGPIARLVGGTFNSSTLTASSTMRRELAMVP